MWIWRSILEVIQQPSHPTPGGNPQRGGVTAWDGDTPSLIAPGSALSPWISLQKAQAMRGSVGHRGSSIMRSPFRSAFAQVRSVGTVEKIDSYFQKYQMGHYQANAVMPHHTPPPGSTIHVVRTDPQDSGIEDVVDTMPSSLKDKGKQYNKNVLTDQELMVYKHALLCAQFPVLGSRLPSSALPSPSSVSSPHGRGGTSLLTSPPPSPGSLSLDGGGDDGDSMVQEETLCVLVKEAFGLSEERHLFYDDHINRGLGNKPPAKHLVEELMGRLSLLQTNSHPFYQPQDFETRNAYDLWQQQEGQRISALINRFWKGPLPNLDPLLCRASYWSSMHDMYQDLMVLLLKHDKVLKAGPTTGCPLLSSSRRLLREFNLQYGIGEVFRRVVYLERMSEKEWFEGEDWFLKHISQSLLGIQELLTKHQGRVTMVRREYELLCRALSQLQERCCEMLERLLQERTPQHRVVCLITNLSDILALSAILLGRNQGNLENIITQCLKESIQNSFNSHKLGLTMGPRFNAHLSPFSETPTFGNVHEESIQNSYNGHKLRLTTELRLNAYSSPVSAELISKLIVHIQSEIQFVQDNYQQLFQLYHVEIMQSATTTLYSCLMADVSVLCDRIQVTQRQQEQMRESVDPEMVAMARRLDRLDQAWKNYIPASSQQWRKSLTKSAVHWFQYLIRDVQAMIVYSICRDKFEAVHLTFSQGDGDSQDSYSGQHRPSNANQLTQSIGSAFASVIPKEHLKENEAASNNNNIVRPKASHPDVTFNPSGVLNFKRPERTQSFPQIKELLDRSEKWSAAGSSKDEGGWLKRPDDGAAVLGGGGDSAFHAVNSRLRESPMNSKEFGQGLTHSQSFPDLSASAVDPSDVPGPSGLQDPSLTLQPHLRHNLDHNHAFPDDNSSGKDRSTSPSRSRSNSSQPHLSSDAEASTDVSSSVATRSRKHHRDQLRAVFEQLGIFSGEGLQQNEIRLPISSSLVDMVYVVRHACSLMHDICNVLKPEVSAETEEDELQQSLIAADLQQLFISPLQGVTFAIRLFASNMLAMDLCATPARDVNSMISKEVLNRVFIAQSAGLLGGCRHERNGLLECNIYFNRDRDCLCDNFEPINPEMCLRINNVQGLIEILPDLLADLDGAIAVRSTSQAHDVEGARKQRPLQKYLHSLIVGQIKLLAFKVNQMLSQALTVLLELDMGAYSIADRLHPLTSCIHNHLVATSSWLYPQCFQVFCQELWKCIVKDFEHLVEELLMEKLEDRKRAMLLLQAIAHIMETIANHSEHGLNADIFLEHADGVIQVLQLYTWPTTRLVQLYQGLLKKAWEGTTAESWPVRRETLRLLQRFLCQQRKCFTGDELLLALVHCQEDFTEENSAENIWDWARHTAEQLLRCGLVRRMVASGHTIDVASFDHPDGSDPHVTSQGEISDYEGFSYPEVTLYSIPRTSGKNQACDTDTDATSDELSTRLRLSNDCRSQETEDVKSSESEDVQRQFDMSIEVCNHLLPSVAGAESAVSSDSVCPSVEDDMNADGSVVCEVPSSDRPVAKVELEPKQTMQRTPDSMHGSVVDGEEQCVIDGDSTEGEQSYPTRLSVVVEDIDQAVSVDQGFQESCDEDISIELTKDNLESPEVAGDSPCGSNANVPSSEEVDQGKTLVLMGERSVAESPELLKTQSSSQPAAPEAAEDHEQCLQDGGSHEAVFKAIQVEDDNRIARTSGDECAIENMAPSPELVSPSAIVASSASSSIDEEVSHHMVVKVVIEGSAPSNDTGPHAHTEERVRTDSSSSSHEHSSENGPKDTALRRSEGARPKEAYRIRPISPEQPPLTSRQSRASTFSSTTSDTVTDSEPGMTPLDGTPVRGPWSPRGIVPAFTADSQQLYCFAQVYDPIPKQEEGALQASASHPPKSRDFQRMIDNLDDGFSPEMVIAIIATRRDESAKDFINQIGDESLLMREASCIKRLCKACFRLR